MGTMQISIDGELGQNAQAMLAEQGYSVSDFVSMTLRALIHEGQMPALYKEPNETTLAAMREADAGNLPQAHSVEEFMRRLNEDD